jgi:hypothetical protein
MVTVTRIFSFTFFLVQAQVVKNRSSIKIFDVVLQIRWV